MIKKLLLKNSLKSTTQNGSSALIESYSVLKKQNISSNIRTVSIVFVCALMFSACKKNQDQAPAATPAKPPMVAIPQRTVPVQRAVSSVLRVPPTTSNQFDFSNKKDPFKPFVAVKSDPLNTADAIKKAKRNSLPIHSFDVGQFKLIGVIIGGRENRAMVTDPGGKGYVLKVGMLIGKNDGKVVSITSNGVDILEQFRDDNGRTRKENIKLTLPRKQ